MKKFLLFVFLTNVNISFAQSLPIFLDGRTDDWNEPVPTYIDNTGDGNQFDFRYFSVTNDELFLFLRLNLTPEMKLLENNQLTLYIDGDNNTGTGVIVNGIGAELEWNFGNRNGTFYKNGNYNIFHSDILFRSLPTVTDTTYEIAIGRDVLPNGNDPLFSSSTIKIFFKDKDSNGDWMPNNNEVFEYTFDNTPTPPLAPIDISRYDTTLLRVMDYNVLQDGLLDPNREEYFTRILQAIKPDIICFNEFFGSSATQVKNKMNQLLPLPNGASWNAVKLDPGNVTVSKYPFIQNWEVYPDHRITASLIDLPSYYNNDIMVINAHYKCCGGTNNDEKRQKEADATTAFILDAKTTGGVIDLPENTPFLIAGDLNLVGDRQQQTTLITGQIINTQLFGNGAPPDWDTTNLEDLIASQTDRRTAYTWRNDGSSFPPGRLDYQIYSNSVMSVEKAFVIQTEVMSPDRLAEYGFQQNDTKNASDHFPKVTDYSFSVTSVNEGNNQPEEFKLEQNYPNPFNPSTKIKFTFSNVGRRASSPYKVMLKVYDVLGNEISTLVNKELPAGSYEVEFNVANLPSGVYFYHLTAGSPKGQAFIQTKKMILLR